LIEFLLDQGGLVRRVPDLGGQEELLTLHDRRNDLLESGTNFVLVLVDGSKIEVSVSVANGNFNLKMKIR
jgi:hypothetical protein